MLLEKLRRICRRVLGLLCASPSADGKRIPSLGRLAEPSPAGQLLLETINITRPGIVVEAAGFSRPSVEALASILSEARREYEGAMGFTLPETVRLEAKMEPEGEVRLWTDGASSLFLRLQSPAQLAPSIRTGVFIVYGLCHELGHIVMYRRMRSLSGLPEGVAEGWAHYAGSVVVDAVASRLGRSIWPEPYDVATTEGFARLQRQVDGKDWAELGAGSRGAKVFCELEKRHGRGCLAHSLTRALSKCPSGAELMSQLINALRETAADPTAGDWIPLELLVCQEPREPDPSDGM